MTNRDDIADSVNEVDRVLKAGETEKAIVLARELVDRFDSSASAWSQLGFVLGRIGNFAESVNAYSRAIDLEPEEPVYYWNRGRIYLRWEKPADAVGDFTEALDLSQKHGSDYYVEMLRLLRAEAFVRLGRCAEARRDCEYVGSETAIWVDRQISKSLVLKRC